MTPWRRFLPVVLLSLAGTALARAQPYSYVSGVILDPSQAAVPGASVSVVNEESGFRRETLSQEDGSYLVTSLQPGIYKIMVRKEGFRTMIRFGVRLELARPGRSDFELAVGSVKETVTVEDAAPLLNREDGSVSTVIGRDRIEHLPVNGHSLLGLLELAPGAVVTPATRGEPGQFSVNGQRPNSNYFTIDGVSANTGVSGGGLPAQSTGGTLPGMTALGSLHSLISLEALEDFRVQTATVVPQFGKLPGAQVDLASRSGSNEFHGSFLYGFRHEDLGANDWFSNQSGDGRAALRLHDFAAGLGGPVWRDRTFFFASYEGLRLLQPFAWQTPVPSLAARASSPDWLQPLLNFFPAPNGPELGPDLAVWTGRNNRPSRLDVGSFRLDHAISSRLTVFGRYNDSPSFNEFGNTQISQLNLRSRSLTLGLNLRARSNLIFDLRANASSATAHTFWKDQDNFSPDCALESVITHLVHTSGVCDRLLRFSISGVSPVTLGREGDRQQTQYHVSQTTSITLGTHSMRVGAEYRRLAPTRRDASGTYSVIANSFDDFLSARDLWTSSSEPEFDSAVVRELSLFVQDTWRIAPRLTATYGFRWEYSPAPSSNRESYFLDPERGTVIEGAAPIWPQRFNNLAPRFGLAFRPREKGGTVVRLGAGLYYDSSFSIATDVVNGGPLSVRQFGSQHSAPFPALLSFGFVPGLRLPVVAQYSASVEHAFTDRDVVVASYVGSQGRRLIRREMGGDGNSPTAWVALATNNGRSRYNGLQLQYRRRLGRRLQGMVSYSWAHSLDNSSSDAAIYWAGPDVSRRQDRASSDFDVRQMLSAAFTWEIPPPGAGRLSGWLRGWSIDGVLHARTGFPINVLSNEQATGISFANAFRPDLLPGQPIWITDPQAPGGRRLNNAAFQAISEDMVQGNLGRNAITAFRMYQVDLALPREFHVRGEHVLQMRMEAFNALNHPNFADPIRYLTSPLFGSSPSMLNLMMGTGSPGSGLAPLFQAGGARSLQVSLRFRF